MEAAEPAAEPAVVAVEFPPTPFNPFGDTTSEEVDEAASLPAPDWSGLPNDVKGVILDYCTSTRDFMALSSVSRAWRYASRTKASRAPVIKDMEAAFAAEQPRKRQTERQRRQLLHRARRLRLKRELPQLVFHAVLVLFGLLCVAAGSLGFVFFYGPDAPAVVAASAANCTWNFTTAEPAPANATLCCDSVSSAPLEASAFALSLFWLMYGAGTAVLAAMMLVATVVVRDWAAASCSGPVMVVGLAICVGAMGLWAIVPCWLYFNALRPCLMDSYAAGFHSWLSAATFCFSVNAAVVFLACCAAFGC